MHTSRVKDLKSSVVQVLGILLALTVVGCSAKIMEEGLFNLEVDPASSYIEIQNGSFALADESESVQAKVYAYNKEGQVIEDFQPVLGVIGGGTNTTGCSAVGASHATCWIKSSTGGEKIVYLKNGNLIKTAIAIFKEPSAFVSAEVIKDNALANGNSEVHVQFHLKHRDFSNRSGVNPQARAFGGAGLESQCSPSGSSGLSLCRFKSKTAGEFVVKSSVVSSQPVLIHFTEPKLVVVTPRADAGNASSKAKVKVLAGVTASLQTLPSDTTITCAAPSGGYSNCDITSNNVGSKVVTVVSPSGIDEQVEVVFARAGNNVVVDPTGPANPQSGGEPYEFIVDLVDGAGNPLAGTTPVVQVSGNGTNTVVCSASDALGKAHCTLQTDTAGPKEIIIKDPPTKETLSVTFTPGPVVATPVMPAGGTDPAIIRVPTGTEAGVVPTVTVSGPAGAESTIQCSPSVVNPDTGEAESLCFMTATESGSYTVNVTSPVAQTTTVQFAEPNASVELPPSEDGRAVADGSDGVQIKVELKNSYGLPLVGVTPVLDIQGSGTNTYTCTSSNLLGEATCTIKSTDEGVKTIRVTTPLIAGEISVQFTSANQQFAPDNVGSGIVNQPIAYTDPESSAVVYIDLIDSSGNPRVGVVPVLMISGAGSTSYSCAPSNSSGVARCEIVSDTAGAKTITVIEPAMVATTTVTIQSNVRSCTIANAANATETWTGQATNDPNSWGACTLQTCNVNYTKSSNVCVADVRSCSPMPVGGSVGTQTWNSSNDLTWGLCTLTTCLANYTLSGSGAGNICQADTVSCVTAGVSLPTHANLGETTWQGANWGTCLATACNYPYKVQTDVCVVADVTPELDAMWGITLDQNNVMLSTVITSNEVTVTGIDPIKIPISITGEASASIEVRKPLASWVDVGASYADLEINDEFRIKMTSASSISTTKTATLNVGQRTPQVWSVTTTAALPPTITNLTHTAGTKSIQISWSTGGIGNGGAFGCKLQYYKDGLTWTDFGSLYDCDSALSSTSVNLPGDGWTNNFASNVSVRIARVSDSSQVAVFTNELTCSPQVLPATDDPTLDENCDGVWGNDADALAPSGGAFTLSATDPMGTSSLTGSVNITLNITCPTDQAGGVQMAFGNTSAPTNWTSCVTSQAHALTAGTGTKTVFVRFKDAYGNTTSDLTQNIDLDQTAPSGGALAISEGAATSSVNVTLSLTCPTDPNGPIEMAFDNTSNPTNWTACLTTQAHALIAGDGNKTVYTRFRDKFGNVTSDSSTSIKLDTTAPVPSLSYTNGWLNATTLALTVSSSDAGNSTPLTCSIEAQSAALTAGVPGSYSAFGFVSSQCTNTSITVTDGVAYKLRMMSTDSLSNASAFVTPALEVKVDTTAPTLSSVTATNTGTQPACGTVRVTVSGAADTNSGLHASAYSFDGGSSWQASNTKDFSTTSLNLNAGQVIVRDVAGNQYSYGSGVSGSSVACSCNLPWGGTINNSQTVTAYASSSPMYPTTCQSEVRTCTSGTLSGSYANQSCTQQYSYSWYQSGWGACPLNSWSYSGTGSCSVSCGGGTQSVNYTCNGSNNTQTQTVYCLRNDGTPVGDGLCSGAGSKPASSQSCWQSSCSGGNPSYSQSCNTQACYANCGAIAHNDSCHHVWYCNNSSNTSEPKYVKYFKCNNGSLNYDYDYTWSRTCSSNYAYGYNSGCPSSPSPSSLYYPPPTVNFVAGEQSTCNNSIFSYFGYQKATCSIGGGCGGANPTLWGACVPL